MSDYISRLITEQQELEARLTKLSTFLKAQKFDNISHREQGLLYRQEDHMRRYNNILLERLEIARGTAVASPDSTDEIMTIGNHDIDRDPLPFS